jgi:hypothetical protein
MGDSLLLERVCQLCNRNLQPKVAYCTQVRQVPNRYLSAAFHSYRRGAANTHSTLCSEASCASRWQGTTRNVLLKPHQLPGLQKLKEKPRPCMCMTSGSCGPAAYEHRRHRRHPSQHLGDRRVAGMLGWHGFTGGRCRAWFRPVGQQAHMMACVHAQQAASGCIYVSAATTNQLQPRWALSRHTPPKEGLIAGH